MFFLSSPSCSQIVAAKGIYLTMQAHLCQHLMTQKPQQIFNLHNITHICMKYCPMVLTAPVSPQAPIN